MMMTAELKAVMGWLETEDVPAIAYKGPTLAAWAYGDIALREFCDLDILVRPSDKERAIWVLIANGCVPKGAPGAADLSGNCEIGLTTPTGCDVDLHWAVSPHYLPSVDADVALTRVHRVDMAGGPLPTFGAEDLFACLALHGARHCWVSLGWICDVANLVRVAPIGWDSASGRAPNAADLPRCAASCCRSPFGAGATRSDRDGQARHGCSRTSLSRLNTSLFTDGR